MKRKRKALPLRCCWANLTAANACSRTNTPGVKARGGEGRREERRGGEGGEGSEKRGEDRGVRRGEGRRGEERGGKGRGGREERRCRLKIHSTGCCSQCEAMCSVGALRHTAIVHMYKGYSLHMCSQHTSSSHVF